MTASSAERLARTDVTGGHRNGLPAGKPYRYGGTDTSMSPAEVAGHLARARARVAARTRPLDDPELLAADLPTSAPREWLREMDGEPGGEAQRNAMATSRAARAAMPAPKVIPGTVVREPAALPAPAAWQDVPGGRIRPTTVAGTPAWWAIGTSGQATLHGSDGDARRELAARDLAGRMTTRLQARSRAPRRCRGCGYLKARCACGDAR